MKNSIKKLFSEILAVLLIVQPISPVFAQGIAEETTQKIVFYENSAEEQSEESAEIKDAVLREQDKQAVPEENKEEEAKENPATENQEEQPAFEQSVNVDGMQITVKADDGVFADADKVSARKVTGKEEEKVNEAIEQEHSDNDRMTKSYTFDIKVLDSKGNELQPNNEKGGVYVSFLPVDTEQEALNKGNIEVSVYHTNSEEMDTLQNEDSLQVTKLNVDVNTESAKGTTVVTAKTDGFSYYTVEFTYGEKQYVLNGDSSTKLTEILKHVGISLKSGNESITKAESSDPELFSVSKNADGEWIVSALKAFSVTEKLTVEADGISYEIAVTDSQHPLTVTGGTEGVDYKWENYAYYLNGDDVVQYPVLRKYMLHILSSKALVIEGDATQFKAADGTANVSYTYFTDEACTIKTTRDNSGADSIGSVPKNVGSYWVQATFAETPRYKAVIAKAGFAISKATVSFTPPTPKTGLTYTGETQELINAGTVDTGIGKLAYSLSEAGTYSETIPRAQDAGTYTVYYKVAGTNSNYDYTNAKGNIEVSIAKVSITPTVAISGWTYGASPNAPTLTGNTGGGAVTYDYFTDESCTIKTTTENNGAESEGGVPKNAGGYWIQATIAETTNYSGATAKKDFEISKANVQFTAPTPKDNLSYTGELQELINAGSVDSNIGKMQYSLSETGTYSETIPTAKDVGSYSVYYKVAGTNANYDYSNAKGSVEVSIHEVYEVKVVDGMGTGKYREGQIVTIKADEKSGYTFIGWTGDDGVVFDNASAKETSFVMPAKNITVTANYSANSSGGSSGGGSGGSNAFKDDVSIIIKTEKAPDFPTTAEIIVKAKKGNDKTATAEISEKTVENAIKKAKEEAKKKGKESNGIALEINIAMPRGTDKVKMNLSENTLGKMVSGEVKHLTVNGSFVKVVFDKNAVFGIKKQSEGDVLVTIIPMKKLSKEPKKLIGNRPVYDISLSNGNGKKITDFGNGTATVLLSYKLEKTETIGGLYAVYVDEKERAFRIDPSAYDVNSGSVIFATNHLSVYGVGYTAPSQRFDDTKKHWAKDFIDYVVGRGLLDGSRENKFYPNEKMTRGMLVTALGKLAGVNVKKYETNSFTDVQNDSFYHPYIEWAYSKGVVYGIGDGTFAPDKSITREEMAVIFERYAKVTGCKIPVTREASVYEDKEQIGTEYRESVKAMQQAGIMMGIDGNKFNPKGNATRAEVSAMLSRYIKLTITPETAQGFVLDDAGKYHYYKDGKALTGKQTLDGTVYFFDESGVLQIGWVKDGNIWRYYDGTKAHKGWLNLKVEGEERIYYLNREGLLESGKWVKIDGKWYYFYPDGTLAVNTEIDGYKVDGKGVRKEK